LDGLQAAILLAKLPYLAEWNRRRQHHARLYREKLFGSTAIPFEEMHSQGSTHVYHLFVVRSKERDALRSYLSKRHVDTGIHYPVPLHQQPLLDSYTRRRLPVTERLSKQILSLPMFPDMRRAEIERVAHLIKLFDLSKQKET
jgi:dTDP-4-amino-4,6-dideoxygalactose transaminase